MVTKKIFVIIVLATLCLTLTLFSIIPVMSVPEYDPWKDVNEDGVIDAKEYQLIKNAIPSMGDPTKNVNVVNFPRDEQGNLKVNIANWTTKRVPKIVTVGTFNVNLSSNQLTFLSLTETNYTYTSIAAK